MTNRIAVIVLAMLFAAFTGTIMPGCEEHDTDHGHDHVETGEGHSDDLDNDHMETDEGHSDDHDDGHPGTGEGHSDDHDNGHDHSKATEEQHDDHDHSATTEIHEDDLDDDDHDHSMDNEEQHNNHDHSATTEELDDGNNDVHGPDESESADHPEHDDEGLVVLSAEAVRLAAIAMSSVEHGRIGKSIDLPGEVGFNEDRLVHVAPRFAGIAKDARYRIGDYVNNGDVVAVVESNESLTLYSIEAPMSGWIIERNFSVGEYVSEQNSIYVIVDLTTVWVNLAVYPKDAEHIAKGQTVSLKAIGSNDSTEGTIEYVTPILDADTRSITARVVLPNQSNTWRPGTFVQARVRTNLGEEGLVVEREAVQIFEEEHVVFVAEGEGHFRPVPVEIGENDSEYVRILSGLEKGTQYVARGAFDLKAEIVTSNLDAHAGHGH